MSVSPSSLELRDVCRHQQDIITLLKNKGIDDMMDLSEVTEFDIIQLKISDLVVRRRLIRHIQDTYKPLTDIGTVEDLCKKHKRSINILYKAGIRSLDDLNELEPEDIADLELVHLPVLRRINKYMSNMKRRSEDAPDVIPPPQRHTRKMSNIPTLQIPKDEGVSKECASPSMMLRGRGKK